MLRGRDYLGIFLWKIPSSYQDGTNNKEDKREGTKYKFQIYFWNDISFPKDRHTHESLRSQSTKRTMAEEDEPQTINEFPIRDFEDQAPMKNINP